MKSRIWHGVPNFKVTSLSACTPLSEGEREESELKEEE